MARYGKIARLSRPIREELNQRLDNGESGVQLIAWLNSLPEVKELVAAHFAGRPINDNNLSEWKHGGFLKWQNRQEALALLRESASEDDELAKAKLANLIQPLAATLALQYADACELSNADTTEKAPARVNRLSNSLRDIVRLSRCEHDRERVEIQKQRAQELTQLERERLALNRQWLELQQSRIQNSKTSPRPLVAPTCPAEASCEGRKSDEGGPVLRSFSEGGSTLAPSPMSPEQHNLELRKFIFGQWPPAEAPADAYPRSTGGPPASQSTNENPKTENQLIAMKAQQSHPWIEPTTSELPANSIKDFPLPKGEGQGEGERCSLTDPRVKLSQSP